MATESRTSLGMKLFLALFILGLVAAGVGATKVFIDNRAEGASLDESGVVVEANVLSATEIRQRRSRYTELHVSYEAPGADFLDLEFATVQDCTGARYEPGTETVDVVYLPNDPEVIRLVDCRSSFDTQWFPGIAGALFIAFALFTLWRLRHFWKS